MVVFVLYAVVMFFVIIRSVRRGRSRKSTGAVILVALVPYTLAALWERRNLIHLVDPRHQAWSLIFGDLLLVPLIVNLATRLWDRLPTEGEWYNFAHNRGWPIVAAVIAAIFTVLFRIHEAGAYDAARYYSIGKLVHDLIGFPAIFGALVFAVPPALTAIRYDNRRSTKWIVVAVAVMVAVFLALLVHDFHGLNPDFLHVQDDWNHWALPVRCRVNP